MKIPMDTVPPEQQQVNLAEEVVRAIGEQVLAGLTFEQTVWLMCRRIVECLHYPLIWIGTKEPDGAIKVQAFGGELGHLVENYQEYWKGKPEKQGAAARAIRDNVVRVFNEDDLAQSMCLGNGHGGETERGRIYRHPSGCPTRSGCLSGGAKNIGPS